MTLALGIGAVTSIFSLLRGVILDPLPYPDPSALIRVFTSRGNVPSFPVTPWSFTEYRRSARSVDVAVYTRQDLQLAADNRPERLRSLRVSAEYFRVIGMLTVARTLVHPWPRSATIRASSSSAIACGVIDSVPIPA